MRCDIHVPNESDGFVFTSAALRGRGVSPGDRDWTTMAAAGDLLPLFVESEDPANVRVVVDEPLDASEQAEWVGVVRSALRVPDGRLALCGGIVYVLDKERWAEEYARVVEIPAGDYRATLYCYASAPNGRLCVERSGSDEPLGAWFRRTRPTHAIPAWLHNLCVNDPGLDPGHGKHWKKAKEKSGGQIVDFLLHLEPTDAPLPGATVGPDGFVEAEECRKPELFPLGIAAANLQETEDEDASSPIEESPKTAAAQASGDLIPIAGGTVGVPVVKLGRVAQLAWMCHPYSHPGLRITFPGEPPRLEDVEDATLVIAGRELRIDFPNNGQPADAQVPLAKVAKQLASVPDGAVLEFTSSRLKTKSELGAHRYLGTVRGGIWHIEASSPPADAARLTEALALVETLENGRRLTTRDEAEAVHIETRVANVLADYFGGNSLQRTGAELSLRRRDPTLFAHVVARVFWSRYADVWPLQDEDAGH
jgi:hypothetical protein